MPRPSREFLVTLIVVFLTTTMALIGMTGYQGWVIGQQKTQLRALFRECYGRNP